MKYWTHVVVEGHCFGDEDENGNNPCGRRLPSPFCLGNGKTGHCPHFAWSDAEERDAAFFVPLRKIVWDKLRAWITEDVLPKFQWWFWGKWTYDDSWLDEIKVIGDDDPYMKKWKEQQRKQNKKFVKWFPKAVKEW